MTEKKDTPRMRFLTPRREPLVIDGHLSYNESNQSWNSIKIKKELLNEFPDLKQKQGVFKYKMILHKNPKEIEKFIKEIIINGAYPILLFFEKVKQEYLD